jgi:hypothetical protein
LKRNSCDNKSKLSAMMANLNGSSVEPPQSLSTVSTTTSTTTTITMTTTTTCGLDELQKVSDFFESNACAIEKWLKEKASDEVITRLHAITKNKERTIDKEQHRSSITSELYQQWLSSSMKVNMMHINCRVTIR